MFSAQAPKPRRWITSGFIVLSECFVVSGGQDICITFAKYLLGFKETLPAVLDGLLDAGDGLLLAPLRELLPLGGHSSILEWLLKFLAVVNPRLPSLAERFGRKG